MRVILYKFSRGFSWDKHIDSIEVNGVLGIEDAMREILVRNGYSHNKIPSGFYFKVRN